MSIGYKARLQVEGRTGRKFWTLEIGGVAIINPRTEGDDAVCLFDFGDNRRLAERCAEGMEYAYGRGRADLQFAFRQLMDIRND